MNIIHLKYAVEIARTKSISKAASNLYMAQPNLSRAIKELEESLGVTIFKRTSKGITVTPEGEEFLQYAKRIIAQVEEVEEIYRKGKNLKQRFSVCVPRASYISEAFSSFAASIDTSNAAEIFYKETNSMRTINNIVKEEYDLGIIRYLSAFEKYFSTMFGDRNLVHETITEFSYVLAVSKNSPLATKEQILLSDLSDYIEICHADPYVPSLPLIDVKRAELSEAVNKRIFVFERASQFDLLEKVPSTFMWVSPIPENLLAKYNLVQRKCPDNTKKYKDILIYRNGYKLTDLDRIFIEMVNKAKKNLL